MGWMFGWHRRRDLVEHVTESFERSGVRTECIAKCWRGNTFSGVLWTVWEVRYPREQDVLGVPKIERFICAFLMKCIGGEWGYKDVDESMGPCELSCPLGYINLAQPGPDDECARNWRQRVRDYHAERKQAGTVHEFAV